MSSDINLNPANEPRFPISPTVLDTEGHGRAPRIEDADAEGDRRPADIEDGGADTEGHRRTELIEGEEDTEGHRRAPGA